MTRGFALIAIVAAVLIGGFLVLTGGPREIVRATRDARALANLPRRDVVEMLRLEDGSFPDLTIFEDGTAGWFEVDTAALPATLEIGFHGPRLFDAFTGNTHLPLYCFGPDTPPGKIIWGVSDRQITAQYSFCNRRRMDLGPLRDFAAPVDLVTEQIAFADLAPLEQTISDDPDLGFVDWPRDLSPFTHRRIIVGPHTWWSPETLGERFAMEEALQAAILASISEGEINIRRHAGANPNMTITVGGRDVTGMAVADGDELRVLEGYWAQPYEIWVDCMPEACAALDDFDFGPFFAQGRDMATLQAGMATGTIAPFPPSEGPTPGLYATIEDLEADSVMLRETQVVTYQVRYIRRHGEE